MDKVATKLLNLYCEKKWNEQARMIDLSGLTKAEVWFFHGLSLGSVVGSFQIHLAFSPRTLPN